MKGKETNGNGRLIAEIQPLEDMATELPDFCFIDDEAVKPADLPATDLTGADGLEIPNLELDIPDFDIELPAFDLSVDLDLTVDDEK